MAFFTVVSFLFIPGFGEWLGLGFSFIVLAFMYLFGDKILLALLGAKRTRREEKLDQSVMNLRCRLRVGEIRVYISDEYNSNIFLVSSIVGCPSIVVGKALIDKLNKSELEHLLSISLMEIKSGQSRIRTMLTLFRFLYFLPRLLVFKLSSSTNGVLSSLTGLLLSPFVMLSSYSRREYNSTVLLENRGVFSIEILNSALEKVFHLKKEEDVFIYSSIVENIAIGDNRKNILFS